MTSVGKCSNRVLQNYLREHTPNYYSKDFLEQFLKQEVGIFPLAGNRGSLLGGFVSSILCNVALNGMEQVVIKASRMNSKVTMIRYGDDIWVTRPYQEIALVVKEALNKHLLVRGINLNEVHTSCFDIKQGGDFLGWNIRKFRRDMKPGVKLELEWVVKSKPTDEAMKRVRSLIKDVIKKGKTLDSMVPLLNSIILDWCKYYSVS